MIISLNPNSEVPIYLQLRNQIVTGIASGALAVNESLPTVRQMAQDIGINTMTVNKSYAMLKEEGYITIDRRSGAKVNPVPNPEMPRFREGLQAELGLIISEAGLKGMSKREFLSLCETLYDSMDGLRANKRRHPDGFQVWL